MPKFDEVAFLEKVKNGGASSKEVREHASAVARDLRAQYQVSMSAMSAADLTGKTGSPAYQAVKQFNENFIAIAQNDILSAKTEKAQQRVFDYYTKLLEESKAIHDYQTATQLHACLTTGPIERIPHLQERIADLELILPSDPRLRIKRIDDLSRENPDRIPDLATARQKISVTADNREIVARETKNRGVFPRLPQLPQFNVEEPNSVQVPETNINERVNRNSVTVTQLQEKSNLIYPTPGARDENPMMGNRVKIQGETVKNEPPFFRQNVLEEFEKLKSADLKGKNPTEHLFKKAVDNIIKKMKIDPELADALREKLPQLHGQGLQAQQQNAAAPVLPPESPRGVAENANPMSDVVAQAAAKAAEAAGPSPLIIEPIDASSASPPLPTSRAEQAAAKVFAESSAYTGARSGGSSPSSSTVSLSSSEVSQAAAQNAGRNPVASSPASDPYVAKKEQREGIFAQLNQPQAAAPLSKVATDPFAKVSNDYENMVNKIVANAKDKHHLNDAQVSQITSNLMAQREDVMKTVKGEMSVDSPSASYHGARGSSDSSFSNSSLNDFGAKMQQEKAIKSKLEGEIRGRAEKSSLQTNSVVPQVQSVKAQVSQVDATSSSAPPLLLSSAHKSDAERKQKRYSPGGENTKVVHEEQAPSTSKPKHR